MRSPGGPIAGEPGGNPVCRSYMQENMGEETEMEWQRRKPESVIPNQASVGFQGGRGQDSQMPVKDTRVLRDVIKFRVTEANW